MRELKFRVWNKTHQMFITYDIAIRNDGPYILTYDWHHDGGKSWGSPYYDYIIQQYTGLKDKNGKEIYEGDIVDQFNDWWGGVWENGLVEYDDKNAKFIFKVKTHKGGLDYVKPIGGWTVIGNIFENPELLK